MQNDENLDLELELETEETQSEESQSESDGTDWKAEALKQKAINQRLLKKKQPIIREETPTQKPSDILKADEFKLYRQGYSEEEIDLIMHNGGMKALENDKSPLALGLKIAREQRAAEQAAQDASGTSGLSDIERKYTVEQMKNMSAKELEDIIGFAQ